MTMATETENNGPESKEIKDVKEMKEALKDDAPPDNKQEEKDAAAKKDEAAGKKDDDAAAAAAGGATTAPAKANIVHHPDYEKDVVYLYQFPRTPLLPSLSPYGLKVETWLRLNGIKYEVSVYASIFLPSSLLPPRFRTAGSLPLRVFPYCVRACVRTQPSVRSPARRSAYPVSEGGSIAFILLASFSALPFTGRERYGGTPRAPSIAPVEAFSRAQQRTKLRRPFSRRVLSILATRDQSELTIHLVSRTGESSKSVYFFDPPSPPPLPPRGRSVDTAR